MVRKIALAICLLVVYLQLASPMQVYADSIYTDGNISSTYKDIFEDILQDININDNYLFFRSGQYEYTMIVGDINLNGTVFTCPEYAKYVLSYENGGYSSGVYDFNTYNGTNFTLDCGSYLVYSDLGHYPKLIERGVVYEYAVLFTLVVIGLCLLIRPIFKHTYRFRSR